MATKIAIKRSSVPGRAPTTEQLDLGELAINTYDGTLYLKKDDGTESIVAVGGGDSDVVDNLLGRSSLITDQHKTLTDDGIFNQWINPVATSRLENGIPYVYWGSVDGTTGEQKVHRCNLSSGKLETKVVLDVYVADDHNAPAVFLDPDGEIIISCCGHGDDHKLYYGVFNTWGDVTALTTYYTMPVILSSTGITYAQIIKLHKRIFIFTRVGSLNWSFIASDDKFATLVGSTSYEFITHTEQVYIYFSQNQGYITSEDIGNRTIRVYFAGNGSTMTTRTIKRNTMSYDEVTNKFFFAGGQIGDADDAGGFLFNDMVSMYEAPSGKRFRFWDGHMGEGPHVLITEYDESEPFGNAKNYLLFRVGDLNITKYEIPVAVGTSLPFRTYFPGMCFLRPKNYLQSSIDSCEIMVATNDGYDGTWQLKRCIFNRAEETWEISTVVSKDATTEGRLCRPTAIDNGYGDVVYSLVREYDTNPPATAYMNYNGRTEILRGASRANSFVPMELKEHVDSNWDSYNSVNPLTISTVAGTILVKTFAKNETVIDDLNNGESLTLMLKTLTYSITWPTMSWVGGSAPTLSETGYNVMIVWKVGGVLYGSYSGTVE
jgi:hypothetical protein